MAFTVSDFEDLVGLLAEHPEWRERLRPLVLGEGLISLPSRMDRVEAALEALTAQVAQLTGRMDAAERQLTLLVAAQAQTVERLNLIEHRLDKIDGRLDKVDGRLGNIEGGLLESKYSHNIHNWFRQWVRRPRVMPVDELERIEAALGAGTVAESEVRALGYVDLLVVGKNRSNPTEDLLIVLEASNTINIDDVARADTRAETLRRVGYATQAVVGGYAVSEGATQLAERLGVAIDVHRPPE